MIAAFACAGAQDSRPSASVSDIHRVDFRNFVYAPSDLARNEKYKEVRARNGRFVRHHVDFRVAGVTFGRVTGVDEEAALAWSECCTGGSGVFTEGYVFIMRGGKPVLLTRIPGSDRASGGICDVRAQDGLIRVGQYGTTGGSCCPEWIETTAYRLNSGRLVQVGEVTKRKYQEWSR